MSTCGVQLIEKELTEKIIAACITARKDLGRGYLESVYRAAVMIVLEEDFGVESQKEPPIPVIYRGRQIGFYRCDLLVEGRVIVEIKAGQRWRRLTKRSCSITSREPEFGSAC